MSEIISRLRESREAKVRELRAILEASSVEGRDLSIQESEDFARVNGEIDRLDARLKEVSEADSRAAQADAAFAQLGGGVPTGSGAPLLPSMRQYQEEVRAVGEASNAFVPAGQADVWYDRLRNASVVLRAAEDRGRIVDFPDNSGFPFNVPKISASATAAMINENTAITPSDPTFASVTLTPRKAAVLTLVSNEALSDSRPSLREVISYDFVQQIASLLDVQFLTGNGSAPNMRGFLNFTSTTAGPSLGANGATLTVDHLADTVGNFATANGNLESAAFFVHPRTVNQIRKFRDAGATGSYMFLTDESPAKGIIGSIFGVPIYVTGNIPITLTQGTSTDTTTLILADMSQVLIGRRKEIEVAYSTEYAFNADQTAIRGLARFDIQPINAAAVVLTTGVRP